MVLLAHLVVHVLAYYVEVKLAFSADDGRGGTPSKRGWGGERQLTRALIYHIDVPASAAHERVIGNCPTLCAPVVYSRTRLGRAATLAVRGRGILPKISPFPQGWATIAIGATASFVALKLENPDHRWIFVVWQVLGIADLVTAVTLGTLATVIDPRRIPTSAMTTLPPSLIRPSQCRCR